MQYCFSDAVGAGKNGGCMNNQDTVEKVFFDSEIIAIIIRGDFYGEGIAFFTPDDFSQQLAYMNRPSGYRIAPHMHNKVQREVFYTQEVLYIRKGKVKVDLYSKDKNHIDTKILTTGDVILLASGGHGFEMIEQTEMIEIKQGPYIGEHDKTRFE